MLRPWLDRAELGTFGHEQVVLLMDHRAQT